MTDKTRGDLSEREPELDLELELDAPRLLALQEALEAQDAVAVARLLEPLHPADVADVLEQVTRAEREQMLTLWGANLDPDVLTELDEVLRDEIVAYLPEGIVADAVAALETDDVVDFIENLDDDAQAEAILDALDDADRVAVERALSYPEYSAGRLMQREVVMAPQHWTVGEAIDYLRTTDDLPEQFYHVILVDPRLRPTGYVTLGKILSSARTALLNDICEESFRTFSVAQAEADVAYAFNQYHLISAPVVDEDNRLVGVITIDDAMAILDEEAEEDILRLAGVDSEGSLAERVFATVRRRFPWLFVNLFTAILASFVISQFEEAITTLVALAVLMPIVASVGGNAGTQSLTVAVRALATRNLTNANVWRVIRREVLVGAVNGMAFATILGIVGSLWFGRPMLGLVIGTAMLINLVMAGLAGVTVPVVLEKLGVDPALASGTFVTTVTDIVGFFAFLGLASIFLM
jgi:magnesium transporter